MTTSSTTSPALLKGEEEYLQLEGGRTLAYAHAGNPASTDVVIFFHGVFGVGEASYMAPALVERGVHSISPTLPGWGNSSSPPPGMTFHECLYRDTTALLRHFYTDLDSLKIYLGGGSYGTVVAQILYGAPYDAFPLTRNIVGVLLLAPFSPPHSHKDYTKALSWGNYVAIGPPTRIIPFNLIHRLGKAAFRSKLGTPEKAAAFIHDFGFKNMTPPEREAYERWREKRGLKEGEAEKNMGEKVWRSVHKNWDGFMAVPEVFHSGWGGYDPLKLDEDRAKKPVLLVMTKEDKDNLRMGEWLAAHLPNARARYEEGGHLASLFVMDDIWEDFMNMCSPRDQAQAQEAST